MIRIIEPQVIFDEEIRGQKVLQKIERCGRVAWKSQERIAEGSAEKFVRMLHSKGHESVFEHVSVTVFVICDRSASHQLIRHRIVSYTQESQRYVNYAKDAVLSVIRPPSIMMNDYADRIWQQNVKDSFEVYKTLVGFGIPPEDARSVLSNCVATEIVMTANLREWRLIFKTRCDWHAQWQIRGIMCDVLKRMKENIPVLFDDLVLTESGDRLEGK